VSAPEPNEGAVSAFWEQCRSELPELSALAEPEAWAFGDSAEMAAELAALVTAGTKRATAGLVAEYRAENEPLPKVGELSIVVGGDGIPASLIRTTEVRVGPLESVDDQFAWDEGEGDRSRDGWLREHRDFFERVAVQSGLSLSSNPGTVFERFEVLYPRTSPAASATD